MAERGWYPQFELCFPQQVLDAANRTFDELHEKQPFHDGHYRRFGKERTRATPFHVRDGVRIWVSAHDLTPDASFLERKNPLVPLPTKPVNGDEDGRASGEGDPRP